MAHEMGCQKSLPTFYQAVTFNTLYPHKWELFREKKTKVPSTVAPLSPASTCCLQTSITPTPHTTSTLVLKEQSPEVGKVKF